MCVCALRHSTAQHTQTEMYVVLLHRRWRCDSFLKKSLERIYHVFRSSRTFISALPNFPWVVTIYDICSFSFCFGIVSLFSFRSPYVPDVVFTLQLDSKCVLRCTIIYLSILCGEFQFYVVVKLRSVVYTSHTHITKFQKKQTNSHFSKEQNLAEWKIGIFGEMNSKFVWLFWSETKKYMNCW